MIWNILRRGRWLNPCLAGAVFFAAACGSLALDRGTGGLAAAWPANAILLSALLLDTKRMRPWHVANCALASFGANYASSGDLPDAVLFTLVNAATPVLTLAVLRWFGTGAAAFESFPGILRFIGALMLSVIAGATVAAVWMASRGTDLVTAWSAWVSSDFLGTLLVTATILTSVRLLAAQRRGARLPRLTTVAWPLLMVFIAAVGTFGQARFPALFVPFAFLLVATYRLGLFGAAMGTIIIMAVGTTSMALGLGPTALISGPMMVRIQFFQFYLVTLLGTCLPLATLLADRRRLAQDRESSERQHRWIVERAGEVIFETNVSGRWTYLNPAWSNVTGHDVTSTIGRSFLSVIVPEHRSDALERLAPLYRLEMQECQQELRYIHADGSERWAFVRSHVLINNFGVVTGTYGTLHDITERVAAEAAHRESEHLYRLLAENSNDMIVRLSLTGVRKYVSPASMSLLGYEPRELIGEVAAGEIHPDDRAGVIAICKSLLAGAPNPIAVYRQRRKDGSYCWLEASYRLIEDPVTGAPREFIASVRDVSRREAAELETAKAMAELREGHRLLSMAESVAQIGHWRLDLASESLFWSDMVCAIHGRTAGYVPELASAIDAYHPDDQRMVQDLVEGAIETGAEFDFEARLIRVDGLCRRVSSRGRAEMAPDGSVVGLFGVIQDVTERYEAGVALQEVSRSLADNNRLLTMAEAVAHLGHWRVTDLNGNHYWSDEVYRIHGVSKDQLPSFASALEAYHPDDRARIDVIVRDALEAGKGYVFRARIFRPDGTLVHVLVRGEADRAADGSVAGLFGIVQDITEQAEAETRLQEREARYRLITEQASDMISLHDDKGRILFMSPSAQTILGYDPATMQCQTVYDYALPEDFLVLDAFRAQLLAGSPGDVRSLRCRLRRHDGMTAWMEIAARQVDYQGQICTIAVCRDVSDRVQVEMDRDAALAAAEVAAAAKSSFLATMSHEIRTPMTGVLGMIELLRTDADPAQRDRFFDTLEQSARTLMTVLDDVLDYSKIEAGNLVLETADFDLGALARSVGDLFGHGASAKGLMLRTILPNADTHVKGDATRIQQVLSNLVSNAIKFTEVGEVAITLQAGALEDDARRWRIEVSDTGIGLDPETVDRLFSPFTQADPSTTRRFGGTGLGLSISKRLVNAMGGEIGVEPRADGGSIFWFDLPLAVGEAGVGSIRLAAPVRAADGTTLNVLLAEDNGVNQLLVTTLLRRMGHDVVCVGNGQLAVEACKSGSFDVILMDMQMPVMDGVAATRAIRNLDARGATIPIVALTADALPERRRFYENIGLSDFLTKPIDFARLRAVLDGIAPSETTVQAARPPSDAVLDADQIGDLRCALGEETVTLLLDMLVEEARVRPARVQASLAEGALDAAGREAHALLGAAGNVGATRLAQAARAVEHAPDLKTAQEAARDLDKAAAALITFLEAMPAKAGGHG
ncbi:PAS domain S-box protein [Sphingomonas sp.]|jgi:PAS domain S-box-containing protein|uniref:PAS domain S-box protein n=1 Tax=Sphingomonas sp. TaxID=28214 RepID=UPI002EDB7574